MPTTTLSTPTTYRGDLTRTSTYPEDVGVIALELYIPNLFVDQTELEIHDGVSTGKYTIGLGQKQMAFVADNEDVNSLCLTAVDRLLHRQGFSPTDFGRVEVGTESILDRSKGVKTCLMQLFEPFGNTDIEGIDNLTACYGGTAALFNAINWVESSSWDGRLAMVVAGDIAVYAEGSARPTGGAGAIAMVIGPNAALVVDRGLRGTQMRHVYDFYKPKLDSEYPKVDGPLSIECYLSALDTCFARYSAKSRQRNSGKTPDVSLESFDALLFHTPFCKIVQKSLGRLVLSEYLANPNRDDLASLKAFGDVKLDNSYHNRELERELVKVSSDLFTRKTLPGLSIAQRVGNMYTPSLYGCLVAFLLSKSSNSSSLTGNKIGMFSYGSGLAATMYSITVSNHVTRVEKMVKGLENVQNMMDTRVKVSAKRYVELMLARESTHNLAPFSPAAAAAAAGEVPLQAHTWYLVQVDEKYRRTYACHKGPRVIGVPAGDDANGTQ